jgi:hypothetical protein
LSSIVLGTEVEQSQGDGSTLTYEGTRILPSAKRQFRAHDKLIYFFEIYESDAGNEDFEVEVLLRNVLSTRQLKVPRYRVSAADEAEKPAATSRFVELEGLKPGHYVLVAKVKEVGSSVVAERRTTFRIVN